MASRLRKSYAAFHQPGPPRRALPILLLAFLLDQLSKWLILFSPAAKSRVPITGFLDFVLIWNTGISYGIFSGNGSIGQLVMVGVTLLICLFFIWMLGEAKTKAGAFGTALIIGGAFGNVIDRIVHGAVVDFISLHYRDYYWYVFNLADIWITLGCILVLIDSFMQKDEAVET
ncbi:MAG: signal peptidase II [Parvibaculales bacterium]